MRHEAGEDESGAGRPGVSREFSPGEGVGSRLLDDGLADERRQDADDRAARLRTVEQTAGRALVGDVDDAPARPAHRPQQALGLLDRLLRSGQRQGPSRYSF
jgi:hypothetical protein